MTVALIIYFISMLGGLSGFLVVLAVVLLFCSVSYFFYHLMEGKEPKNSKKFTMIMGLSVFLFALNVMIPKECTAWLMLGGYTLQTAYESEDGKKYRKIILKKIEDSVIEEPKKITK